MIRKSRINIELKTLLTIFKLVIYLFLYNHWTACYWHLSVCKNGPVEHQLQEDGTFMSSDGALLLDADGKPVTGIETRFMSGYQPKVAETDWNRMQPADGILGWSSFNNRWDSRTTQWIAPIDFVNPSDQLLFTGLSLFERYCQMFYYAEISLGISELGPKNTIEYMFSVSQMILSAIVFSTIFSQIGTIYE